MFRRWTKRFWVVATLTVALSVVGCSDKTKILTSEPTATVESETDTFVVPEWDYSAFPDAPTATPWPDGIIPFTRHPSPTQDGNEIEIWAEPQFGPFQFSERDLAFHVGDTVTLNFRTRREYHTFTVIGLAIDEVISPGQDNRFTYSFHEPGTFTFYCIPHTYMTGTITVTKSVKQQ